MIAGYSVENLWMTTSGWNSYSFIKAKIFWRYTRRIYFIIYCFERSYWMNTFRMKSLGLVCFLLNVSFLLSLQYDSVFISLSQSYTHTVPWFLPSCHCNAEPSFHSLCRTYMKKRLSRKWGLWKSRKNHEIWFSFFVLQKQKKIIKFTKIFKYTLFFL